jgi:hypothetical protein
MPRFQYFRVAAIVAALFAAAMPRAFAQEGHEQIVPPVPDAPETDAPKEIATEDKPAGKNAKPKKPFGGGTPVDVIVNNKFWVDAPEPKGFVKDNRRPVEELKYQPTIGLDPERPKTRTKDELKDLQSELEQAAVHNVQSSNPTKKVSKNPTPKKAKTANSSDKPEKPDKAN